MENNKSIFAKGSVSTTALKLIAICGKYGENVKNNLPETFIKDIIIPRSDELDIIFWKEVLLEINKIIDEDNKKLDIMRGWH